MKNIKFFFLILLMSVQVTAQQDTVFFTSNYFSHDFFERWPDYEPEEIMRRADLAANEAFRMAYEENNLNFSSAAVYNHFLEDGLYMDLGYMDFILAGVAASSGNPEPLGTVNELRSWNKTPQTIFYIPDDWTISATDPTSPGEYATINDVVDLTEFDAVRMNIVLMKETNLTTVWDQDSIIALFQVAHGAICHNDGFEHDNSNCNLHSTSAGGICFTIPDDRLDQVRNRAQWRCDAFEEVRLELLLEIELCEDESELIDLNTNVDDLQFEASSGVVANIIDDQLELQATADGTIEFWATDGTIDTVRKIIQVYFLENEMRDTVVNLSQGDEFTLADGIVVTDMGTYTAIEVGGAENGCDVLWSYEVNVSTSVEEGLGEDTSIEIYPNPVNETLQIYSPNISLQKMKIYELNGKLKLEVPAQNKIDVTQLSQGVYVLVLEDQHGKHYQKVITKI